MLFAILLPDNYEELLIINLELMLDNYLGQIQMTTRTGYANLPLHGGKAPAWLFVLMKQLAREISEIIVSEFGAEDLLRKLSDPIWFQAFGCVLGFDWHSSGLTTTTLGALKEALRGTEKDLGVFVAGGKGKTSRKTPEEIETFCSKFQVLSSKSGSLVYSSKIAAKVDNSAVQDGYQLYHHNFIFTNTGKWAVIQQGMNADNRYARRYHWLSDDVTDFICEPHSGIAAEQTCLPLNMVALKSVESRKASVELAKESPDKLVNELKKVKTLDLSRRHEVLCEGINPDNIYKSLVKAHEKNPKSFEELLSTEGVGPKAIRALALLSDLIFKAEPSFEDPAKYSFAHGGKDGHPYPVDKENYLASINILHNALIKTKVGQYDKMRALGRLRAFL